MGARLAALAGKGIVALAIFLAASAVVLRAIPSSSSRRYAHPLLLYPRGPDPDLPYLLRPDLQTTISGTAIRVNHFGLRGRAVAPTPAPGVRRILLVGDSVVFGMGLGED